MSEKICHFPPHRTVTYLGLLKVAGITMKLSFDPRAVKVYGVFKTIETVSGKFPLCKIRNGDASVCPHCYCESERRTVKIKFSKSSIESVR
jgi:hypothetical protein